MSNWTLDDIPWGLFDRRRVNPDILCVVKAAALVERNAGDYGKYLCNVFEQDAPFRRAVRRWAAEECQHGHALARWAALADPGFDPDAAFARFVAGYRIPVATGTSVRGSQTGELVARCVVESGTSSFYSALGEACDEPVLRALCARIAADEFRHYRLFYDHLQLRVDRGGGSTIGRLQVAFGRFVEMDDDELAFAYHCANTPERPYDRLRANRAYAARAFRWYREPHVARAVGMMLKAAGIRTQGSLARCATWLAWRVLRYRVRRLQAA